MSTPAPGAAYGPQTQAGVYSKQPPIVELCPLCGAPLQASQEWCLSCGAAARTRLAATPRWWMPIAVLVVIVAASLGVLIASLVKIVG